ncbi:MAG: ATP-binding cassette domain-containing protein [Flavobacteriales bacterium]|nr:ATP-binding cassette domain-containing protein [Flavobacteriales bacterium]
MSNSTFLPLRPGQRFWRLLKPDAREIRNVYVYALFSGIMSLSLPLGIQAILNLIQGGQISTSWIVLVTLVIVGVAISGILQIYQLKITETLQQRIFTRAALEFAYRIPRIKMAALYRHYAPELMNRFFDIISVQKGLSKILIDFSTAILHVFFGLILLSFYHPFFILFGIILLLLIFIIFRFTSKKGLETSLEESKYKYKVAHWLEELARTATTFKLAGKTDLPLIRTDHHVMDYLSSRRSHFKVLLQQYALLVIFKVIVVTGLLALGGILVMEQHMNIGQFVAAEIIILLVINSVEKLILSMETIYDVLTALEKVGQVTDLELEKEDGIDLKDHCQSCQSEGLEVELNGIDFSFPDQPTPILQQLSLHLNSNDRIVIQGKNGSGKSTLLQLLAGLYEPDRGYVSYNGLPKRNFKPSSLHSVIGDFLTQEQLFDGSILENITMGREDASFENVQWAVRELGLGDFIKAQDNGYNTILDPEGKKLPRSIVQKLLLARSIVDKPKLLLLEDAFEHLEQKDRRKIIDFLTSSENKWTLVAISSDSYVAEACDNIALMKNGAIVEIGSYQQMKDQFDSKTYSHA